VIALNDGFTKSRGRDTGMVITQQTTYDVIIVHLQKKV